MWRKLIISGFLLAGVTMMAPTGAAAREPTPQPSTVPSSAWKQAFVFADKRIDQSSGLAASRVNPGVVWTFNDTGGPVRLFAVGSDGRTRAVVTLDNVKGVDPEAMAAALGADGTDYLYVGDIGGNASARSTVVVYRLAEPTTLSNTSVRATAYRLTYPDGAHDAETLLVDPRSQQLYVVTKSPKGGNVYRAPAEMSETGTNALTLVRRLPYVVSDGLITPNGAMILRSYNKARVWDGPGGDLTWVMDLPKQQQGEGIAIAPDGRTLLISSEGVSSPVWQMELPTALGPEGAVPANDTTGAAPESEADSLLAPGRLWAAVGGIALLVLTASLIIVIRAENRGW
ncbi:hypothetical protein [Sphaerimonospora thailandensis]|uniref:WD40 repeat domain-containing protein n=1 Tax=Sphaerimonospora thailandensis TaxID=795644 RepID=A0A8J3VYJ6_9ACTN|nr:hypothetical protein [Sphaerimonospora thailandensis]GIH69078.1 hypothetical protein Mth01_13310 [Sphaerimonospora thailandensis]